MASGRQTEDQDNPNLCTDFESVNDDWDPISGPPLRPAALMIRTMRPDR